MNNMPSHDRDHGVAPSLDERTKATGGSLRWLPATAVDVPNLGNALTRVYRKGVLEAEGFPIDDVSEYLADPDTVVWVDFCLPSLEQIHHLDRELGLHELAVEDALGSHQRPKLDHYATHLFLSCHAVRVDVDSGHLVETEIDAFLNERWLITVRKDERFSIDAVLQRWDRSPDLAAHGVSFLLYGLLDVVVDGYFDAVQGRSGRAHPRGHRPQPLMGQSTRLGIGPSSADRGGRSGATSRESPHSPRSVPHQ